jgi:hypothetical protein
MAAYGTDRSQQGDRRFGGWKYSFFSASISSSPPGEGKARKKGSESKQSKSGEKSIIIIRRYLLP